VSLQVALEEVKIFMLLKELGSFLLGPRGEEH
jgi:hypothetical protein